MSRLDGRRVADMLLFSVKRLREMAASLCVPKESVIMSKPTFWGWFH